jgi:lipoyl(octanoyl) transferase
MLEEVMIRTSADFGVTATREAGKTGVWSVPPQELTQSTKRTQSSQSGDGRSEKIGAIGVHISRWVTSHGFAYNVSTDLRFFDLIVPCGIADRRATSMEKLLGHAVDCREVGARLTKPFGEIFALNMQQASRQELLETLDRREQLAAAANSGTQPEFIARKPRDGAAGVVPLAPQSFAS